MNTIPVLNVFMPFATLMYPSLSLSLFKTRLQELGIPSKVLYFNAGFARHLGVKDYYDISEKHIFTYGNFLGEWLFSGAVYEKPPESPEAYMQRIARYQGQIDEALIEDRTADALEQITAARGRVDSFLDSCLEEVAQYRPRLVGFSSMFQQHMASLALAKRIKAALPETVIV